MRLYGTAAACRPTQKENSAKIQKFPYGRQRNSIMSCHGCKDEIPTIFAFFDHGKTNVFYLTSRKFYTYRGKLSIAFCIFVMSKCICRFLFKSIVAYRNSACQDLLSKTAIWENKRKQRKKRPTETKNRIGRPKRSACRYFASMVETHMVISSRTSKSARTVSSDVKTVTLFSTAQRRIMLPSEFISALP